MPRKQGWVRVNVFGLLGFSIPLSGFENGQWGVGDFFFRRPLAKRFLAVLIETRGVTPNVRAPGLISKRMNTYTLSSSSINVVGSCVQQGRGSKNRPATNIARPTTFNSYEVGTK